MIYHVVILWGSIWCPYKAITVLVHSIFPSTCCERYVVANICICLQFQVSQSKFWVSIWTWFCRQLKNNYIFVNVYRDISRLGNVNKKYALSIFLCPLQSQLNVSTVRNIPVSLSRVVILISGNKTYIACRTSELKPEKLLCIRDEAINFDNFNWITASTLAASFNY